MSHAEAILYQIAEWVKLGVEAVGILAVAYGIVFSLVCYGRHLFGSSDVNYLPLRRSLARYLIVALEFQLAADILATAIAPGWDEIGQLAAVAAIRTVLNYFLEKEIRETGPERMPAPDES